LRQVEAAIAASEMARKVGVHENTVHLWKKRFGNLGTPEIRELSQLREESVRLKRLVADLTLDKTMCRMCSQKSSQGGASWSAISKSAIG